MLNFPIERHTSFRHKCLNQMECNSLTSESNCNCSQAERTTSSTAALPLDLPSLSELENKNSSNAHQVFADHCVLHRSTLTGLQLASSCCSTMRPALSSICCCRLLPSSNFKSSRTLCKSASQNPTCSLCELLENFFLKNPKEVHLILQL